jgi:NitT/TauT family transport system substrate-binding protein
MCLTAFAIVQRRVRSCVHRPTLAVGSSAAISFHTIQTIHMLCVLTRSFVMRVLSLLQLLSRVSRFLASGRSSLARTMSTATLAGGLVAAPLSHAADHVTLLTNWYAQAEHGGFYQAVATGIYQKYGLDVTIKMGGPQVNGMQLLAGGQADFMLGYDFQTLSGVEAGIPGARAGGRG